MADSGGQITWHLDVDDSAFNRKLAQARGKAGTLATDLGKAGSRGSALFSSGLSGALTSISNFSAGASRAFGNVADGISGLASRFKLVGVAALAGLGGAAFASLKMAKSVQSSTIALSAYVGSAKEAAGITKELIDFARSDQGVLFNRDELLSITQRLAGLRMEGLRTKTELVGFIKSVAPAAAVFKQNAGSAEYFGEILGQILGTGKLLTQDYRQLANAGIILDRSLIGQSLSADQLREALSKAIPAEILDKQAQTIEGRTIRLSSSFRQLGDDLLGVVYGANEFGATFAPGSLGDQAMQTMQRLTDTLKSPEMKDAFKEIGQSAATALRLITDGFLLLLRNIDTVKAVLAGFAAAWAFAKVMAGIFKVIGGVAKIAKGLVALRTGAMGIGALAAAIGGPIAWAIAAVVGGIAFLLVKFDLLDDVVRVAGDAFNWLVDAANAAWPVIVEVATKIWDYLKPALDAVVRVAGWLWAAITGLLVPALQFLWDKIEPLLPILKWVAIVLGVIIVGAILVLVTAIGLFVLAIVAIVAVVTAVVGGIISAITWLWNAWNDMWYAIGSALQSTWTWIKNAVRDGINFVKNVVSAGVNGIVAAWDFIKRIPGIVAGAFSGVYNAVKGGIDRALGAVKGAARGFLDAGKGLINAIVDGIKSAPGKIVDAIKSMAGAAAKFLPFSDAKKGPFSHLTASGRAIPGTLAQGIRQNISSLEAALGGMPGPNSDFSTATDFTGTGGQVNIYPKQLTESDIDMATNRLAFKQGMAL